MIETVYSNENGVPNRTGRIQTSFKMPKNIRQVGKSNAIKKIYVEDYVMTFIKQLAGEDYSKYQVAVLVGQYIKLENSRCLFISGALEVEDIDLTNGITFTNDIWNSIYENIKKYFVEAEIVGWFLGGPGYLLEDKEKILKAHIDNFAGQDKTLLTYDNMEKEESFFFYENGRLSRQEGYYIYYEKNEEMQTYMVEHNKSGRNEAGYDDRISREIRAVIQNKRPLPDEGRSTSRLMYAAGTLLAVIILVVGAAMLNNYDQMKTMQKALDSLSHNLDKLGADSDNSKTGGKTAGNRVDQTGDNQVGDSQTGDNQAGDNQTGDSQAGNSQAGKNQTENSLDIEVVPGNVTPIEEGPQEGATDSHGKDGKEQAPHQKDQISGENSGEKEVRYYIVEKGDSLAGISYRLYNSANYISVIKKMNNIEDEDMIYIGQKLILP